MGFPRDFPRDFPRAEPEGNPEENPYLPDSEGMNNILYFY